jgi:Tol biopolymer transport system component
VLVAVALPSPHSVSAAFPGRNGKIAFARDGCNGCSAPGIWVMRADGSHRRNLTPKRPDKPDAYKWQPAFSPSAKRIAFVRYHPGLVIHVMRADGTHKRALRHGRFGTGTWLHEEQPAFSRSGRRIIFSGWRGDGPHKIFAMRANGTHLHALTDPSTCDAAFSPAFSPTGPKIAFVCGDGGRANIYVMRADGTRVRQLTSSDNDSNPNLSPNGNKISFDRFDPASRTFQVYVMRADGTHVRQLTGSSTNGEPAFSPSGRRIAFTSFRDRRFQIYVMRADGTHQHRLATGGRAYNPDWGVRPR